MTLTTPAPLTPAKPISALSTKTRIASIDMLRGLVMIIMAIDHLRELLHLGHPDPTDLQTTTPALFFSRWITHFCAPTFVFLSGISAFLAGRKRSSGALAGFLIKRGFWLIFVEIFIIGFETSVDPFYHVIVLQVIWAIGASMVILGLGRICPWNTVQQGCRQTKTGPDIHRAPPAVYFCHFPRFQHLRGPGSLVYAKKHDAERHLLFERY
jgi:hypothetical protein